MTTYYPYLANLLGTIAKKLKQRVRCVIHPDSTGAARRLRARSKNFETMLRQMSIALDDQR